MFSKHKNSDSPFYKIKPHDLSNSASRTTISSQLKESSGRDTQRFNEESKDTTSFASCFVNYSESINEDHVGKFQIVTHRLTKGTP